MENSLWCHVYSGVLSSKLSKASALLSSFITWAEIRAWTSQKPLHLASGQPPVHRSWTPTCRPPLLPLMGKELRPTNILMPPSLLMWDKPLLRSWYLSWLRPWEVRSKLCNECCILCHEAKLCFWVPLHSLCSYFWTHCNYLFGKLTNTTYWLM